MNKTVKLHSNYFFSTGAQTLTKKLLRKDKDRYKRHGVTPGVYKSLVQKQLNRCAICKRQMTLNVDMFPNTSNVRGLLCRRCKALLNSAGTVYTLKEAIKYLESH